MPPRRPGGGRPPGPPSGGRGGVFKGLMILGLVLIGLVAAGVGLVLLTGPQQLIRDQIVAQVKARTGRDLVIAGPSSFRVYPSLGLSMADVSLSAPPQMAAEPLVTMKELTVSVGLWPLLKREVVVERLSFDEPVFNFEVDASGARTWDFAHAIAPHGDRPVRVAQAQDPSQATDAPALAIETAPTAAQSTRGFELRQLALSDVRIANGTVTYTDHRSGIRETLSGVNLQLAMPSIELPLNATGDLTWKQEKLDLALTLDAPKDLVENRPVTVAAKIDGQPLSARYDGRLSLEAAIEADGDLEVRGQSLAALALFSGAAGALPNSAGPFDIKGKLRASAGTYTLSGMTAALDQAKASGDVAVTTGAARPILKANLKLSELNLDTLLQAGASGANAPATQPNAAPPAPAAKPVAPSAPAPASPAAPQSIEDLLEQGAPADGGDPGGATRVQGFTQRLGLSTEPIDVSALDALDADVSFDAVGTVYRAVVIDRAAGRVELSGRVLKLSIAQLQALQGGASGFLSVDGRAAQPAVGANVVIEGLSLVPVARLAGIDAVSGSGRIGGKIAMAGQGVSQREIADSLAGETVLALRGGNLTYASGAQKHQIEALNIDLGVTSLSGPLSAKGDMAWNGENVAFDGTLATLALLADSRPVTVKAKISGRPVTANYDGTIAYSPALGLNGALTVKSPSIRTLAGWVGTQLPEGTGFGPIDLTGKVAAADGRYSLTGSKIALDGETATGDIAVDASGKKPLVKANLKLTGLDLNKYIAGLGGDTAGPARKSATPAPAAKAVPQVRGYSQRGGWSEEPYDLSALGLIDLDARLDLGRLRYKDIKVGKSRLNAALKDQVLKTAFDEVQLYQGSGKGQITVDATAPRSPNVGASLSFNGVETLPLLKDAADLNWLSGKGKVDVTVNGQGPTQRALMNSLAGKANLNFVDGAIVGINIPGLYRNITQGRLGGLSSSPSEKTDFSELSSSWTIAKGVASNQDLTMLSPLLRVTGSGKVMVGARGVDYLLRPRLVSELAGQGGDQARRGIEIPVRVHGSWEKPKFTPDLKGILSNPDKALDAVKDIGKQLKGKNAEELLKGILGGQNAAPGDAPTPEAPSDAQAAPKKPSKTERLLEQLLQQ